MGTGFEVADRVCAVDGCEASFRGHHWGAIKAHDAGWFQQKDGTDWCPDHNPPWVEEWRARQRGEKPKNVRWATSRVFPARFASVCGPDGEHEIEAGDDIVMFEGHAWHDVCAREAGLEVPV